MNMWKTVAFKSKKRSTHMKYYEVAPKWKMNYWLSFLICLALAACAPAVTATIIGKFTTTPTIGKTALLTPTETLTALPTETPSPVPDLMTVATLVVTPELTTDPSKWPIVKLDELSSMLNRQESQLLSANISKIPTVPSKGQSIFHVTHAPFESIQIQVTRDSIESIGFVEVNGDLMPIITFLVRGQNQDGKPNNNVIRMTVAFDDKLMKWTLEQLALPSSDVQANLALTQIIKLLSSQNVNADMTINVLLPSTIDMDQNGVDHAPDAMVIINQNGGIGSESEGILLQNYFAGVDTSAAARQRIEESLFVGDGMLDWVQSSWEPLKYFSTVN